jgi:plastocyanin
MLRSISNRGCAISGPDSRKAVFLVENNYTLNGSPKGQEPTNHVMKSFAISRVLLTTAVSLSIVVLGCGGGGGGDAAPGTSTEADAPAAAQGPMGTAMIMGTVNFTGTAPDRVQLTLDRECAGLNDATVRSEEVVVNDGKLQWAFVYVKEGIEGSYSPPAEPVVIDQRGCTYQPHVLGVQTGQNIRILNSDPLLHNIHAMPETNRPFNFGMPRQGDERDRSFPTEEVMVWVKCDVHPWMGAWVGVLDHPFYAVSGADGTFMIDGLPAGTYTVEMWHEKYGTQTMEVTVADGASATADFTVDAASATS